MVVLNFFQIFLSKKSGPGQTRPKGVMKGAEKEGHGGL